MIENLLIAENLNFGQKLAEGKPEDIQNDEAVIEAYLGKPGLGDGLGRLTRRQHSGSQNPYTKTFTTEATEEHRGKIETANK